MGRGLVLGNIVRALAALILLGWVGVAEAQPVRHLSMELVPETARPATGTRVTVALAATPAPGWHGYWKNGGDAGVETRLDWTLPAGMRAGAIRYPVPGRLIVAGLMNYVYERPYALLIELTVPPNLPPGTRLPVRVRADYLVCSDTLCVPEQADLATELTVGDGAIDPGARARFDAWRQALPRPLGAPATFEVAGGRFRLAVPFPRDAPAEDAYFYPLGPGLAYAAPQRAVRQGDLLTVETDAAGDAPARMEGVLSTGGGRGFALAATPGRVAPMGSGWRVALLALLGALAGGVLLNVMPCVFPILSLKALSLARSGESEAEARAESLAYTAGVVLVCLGLGGALLALRAGGASLGWAFQLQHPGVVLALLLLTGAITLNLLGVFELPTPRFAGRGGGAFATGALAAFVATPCSGPFMGAALGAALVLPTLAALLVFAGLGLGIALPFLLVGFVPALRRRLPRPGAWMVRLRRVLAVPMALTALALGWVLWRQAGSMALAIGLGVAALLGLALWRLGRGQARGQARGQGGWMLVPALALCLAAALWVRPAARAAAGGEAFSEARLAALRAERRPVFAYFTADWCVTCKVNEAAAIDTAATRAAFRRKGITVLVGDWTDGDPALGRFLEQHGRAGVPLYLYYAPGVREPRVLPQVLTPGALQAL